jgi:hypothetical protein
MALVLKDRVKETTTTTGTTNYTLLGAENGFEAFSVIGDTNTTYYCCTDGVDFEVGIGTYTSSGTVLARTTVLQSSNSDAAVSWSNGTRTIFCTQPAEKAVFLDASGNMPITNNATVGGSLGVTGSIEGASLDISGNIDVDGTSNLDIVDIDGAVDMATTLQVDGVATFTGRDIHSGGITIANAGQIGSVGDLDAMAIASNGVVTFSQIPVLPANSIDSDNYVDDSIDNAHLANDAVGADELAANAVVTASIVDDNVTTAKIADGNVTTAKIAADAITGAKIADNAIESEHYAAASIDTEHIANLQITTGLIAADAITAAKIADDVINSEHYAADSIDNEHLANDAVGPDELASDAVVTASIVDANVTLAKIANQAANTVLVRDANSSGVVSAKAVATTEILIGDGTGFTAASLSGDVTMTNAGVVTIGAGAVENSMLADDAVGADELAANAVVNASVASGAAITDSKLAQIATAGKVALTALEIDGGTDIGADLTTADLIIVDDAAGGTNRKAALSRVVTLMTAQGFITDDPTALAIALG